VAAVSAAYALSVGVGAVACAGLCVQGRRRPGRWRRTAARALSLLLVADAVTWTVGLAVGGGWSWRSDLPLALCDLATLVAAAACWWPVPVLVELTYFWGLAGTLQAVVTPDLGVGATHLEFWEYVVAHVGIVTAALFLVVGLGLRPRRHAVPRVFVITAAYTAFVGLVDWATGANYMYLRRPPAEWTLLRVLGPWPWYVLSAAGVAFVLLVLLDLPFHTRRRAA
jgi:hypothetical integral membrane protein (TIGR02206 family)